jgi:hypothetical protein
MTLELFGYNGIKNIAVIIEFANIGLLTGILYLYTKSYRQIKIGFTVGLILFALMLLAKSISTIAFLLVDSDLLIGRSIYIGGIIEFISLLILFKIIWDY